MSTWHFDEGTGNVANDTAGARQNGTVVDATWTTGKFGGALDFSGTNGYVALPSFPAATSLSISAWVKPLASMGTDSIIMSAGNATLDFRIDSDGFLSGGVGGALFRDTNFNLYSHAAATKWFLVVYTYDAASGVHNLYRDGALVASLTKKVTIGKASFPLWIGRHPQYSFGTFQGAIDEVNVFDQALTAQDVTALLPGPATAPSKPSISSFTAALSSVTAGKPSTLSWSTTGATSIAINPGNLTSTQAVGSVSVSPSTTTTYTLAAANSAGSVSQIVAVTVTAGTGDTTAPSVPTSLAATTASGSQVNLSWAASTDNVGVTGYKVFRNGSQIGTATSTVYQDSGLSANTTYTYAVAAYDAAGNVSAPSASKNATTLSGAGSGATAVGNGITIRDTSGKGQTNSPFTISRVFGAGEFPAGSYPQARLGGSGGTLLTTQVDVKNTWQDGSIKHAMVSFVASIPVAGSISIDFTKQSTSNNSGFLDKNGMLNYGGGAWGAQMEATGANTAVANARTMLSNWDGVDTQLNGTGIRYWLKGPIVTQVILEDRSATARYDMGWDSFKPLHPIFVVSFYPTTSYGAKVEYILENMWNQKLEDQQYSLALKTGASANSTVYTKPSFTHSASTRWRKIFWSGSAPNGWRDAAHPGVIIDYKLPYLIQSKALPSYDVSKVVDSTGISTALSGFAATDQGDINGSAQWLTYMPQTGGRDDIGLLPLWYVRYLYTMSSTDANAPELYKLLQANANVSGHVPIHYREGRSGTGSYCGLSAACTSAGVNGISGIGRSYSLDAYPTGPVAAVSAGTIAGTNWTPDTAHQASYAYLPYLITGDWYFLEELYFWSAFNLNATPAGTNRFYQRHDDWGYVRDQVRGDAWTWRTLGETAFMAPDGTPEQAYYRQKLLNNIAIREGKHNITTGYGYANDKAKWQWGYSVAAASQDYDGAPRVENPLNFVDFDEYESLDNLDTAVTQFSTSQWMTHFCIIVLGHLEEMGFPTTEYKNAIGRNLLNQILNPAYNPFLAGEYRTPVTTATSGAARQWFQTWGSVKSAFLPTEQNRTTWLDNSDTDPSDGYAHYTRAALQFLSGLSDGSYTGDAAIAWANANVCCQSGQNNNPKWAFVPRK